MVNIFRLSKDKLVRIIAKCAIRIGLLPVLLAAADSWHLGKKTYRGLAFPLLKRRTHPHFQILYYHRVNNENNPMFRGVPVEIFAKQMEMLRRYFNVLPLEELVERTVHKDIPANTLAITFDDGYHDNYEYAFPILKKYKLPATIFLTTGPLDSHHLLWHDRVFAIFRQTIVKRVLLGMRQYSLCTLSEKRIALEECLRELRRRQPHDRDIYIHQLASDLGVLEPYDAGAAKVNWQEVQEMARENITFGSHTVTHPILTQMTTTETLNEILVSKTTIEERLQLPVKLFAYPNGGRDDFNEWIKQTLKEIGFIGAVTTLWGTNGVHTDLFELRRMGIWNEDLQMSALKLSWHKFLSWPEGELPLHRA